MSRTKILPHVFQAGEPGTTWCSLCNTARGEFPGLHLPALTLADVPVSETEWTPSAPIAFRVWRNRLYRRELGEMFFGGYQIKYVSLSNSRLVAEWLGAK